MAQITPSRPTSSNGASAAPRALPLLRLGLGSGAIPGSRTGLDRGTMIGWATSATMERAISSVSVWDVVDGPIKITGFTAARPASRSMMPAHLPYQKSKESHIC